jgi:hypothetical protein
MAIIHRAANGDTRSTTIGSDFLIGAAGDDLRDDGHVAGRRAHVAGRAPDLVTAPQSIPFGPSNDR